MSDSLINRFGRMGQTADKHPFGGKIYWLEFYMGFCKKAVIIQRYFEQLGNGIFLRCYNRSSQHQHVGSNFNFPLQNITCAADIQTVLFFGNN